VPLISTGSPSLPRDIIVARPHLADESMNLEQQRLP
jgi:hypothetical protein